MNTPDRPDNSVANQDSRDNAFNETQAGGPAQGGAGYGGRIEDTRTSQDGFGGSHHAPLGITSDGAQGADTDGGTP